MRRPTALLLTLLLLAAAALAGPEPSPPAPSPAPAKPAAAAGAAVERKGPKRPITVRGEILDMACYTARGFSGPVHRDCARQCLASGVPMGIMGPDSTVYVLTQDHGRAMAPTSYVGSVDYFAQCKTWASLTVEVTGLTSIRNGVRVLEVTVAKLPAPAAPAGGGATP
jgi:hypothetical protein